MAAAASSCGAAGHSEPWRLVDLAAQVEDRQAGYRAEAEQEAPGEVVGRARGQQDRGDQRADDQACALHGEHESDHLAAGRLAGVLAHDRRGDRVVAADADPEDDPADEQERVVRRERRGDGAEREDQHLIAVDLFAPEDVGDPAEHDRAHGRSQQGRGVQPRHLGGRQFPLGFNQHHDDADDEQVVGVGEEAHARDEHDLVLEPADLGVVDRREGIGAGRRGRR